MSDDLVIDNVTIAQGATFARRYPVDLITTLFSAAIAAAQVRPNAASATILYTFVVVMVPDPDPVANPHSGWVEISVPPAASWGFTWSAGVFDVLVTASDGGKFRIGQGSVTVNAGVTR